MIKTLNNQEGRKVRVRLDGETFEATIVKGDFTDCEQREIEKGEDTYTLRFDEEAEDGGTFWSPFYLEDEEDFKHRGFDIISLGTKLDKHNIPYNVGKRAKLTFSDGEIRTGVINTYGTLNLIDGSEEVMHELTYDEPTDLGFTKYAPIENCDNIELIDEVEITRENIFDHIGEKVVYKWGDSEKVGTLVQGSFHDCEGNLVELGIFDVSIRYDKRSNDNTLMFTDILSVFSIMKEMGGNIFLLESEEDSLEIGDVVKITSKAIHDIMNVEDIQVPYGIYKGSGCYDMLRVSSTNPERHRPDWNVLEDSIEKVYPTNEVEHGDLILVKRGDLLTYGTYMAPNKEFIVGGNILESQHGVVITYDGFTIDVDQDTKLYDMEVL